MAKHNVPKQQTRLQASGMRSGCEQLACSWLLPCDALAMRWRWAFINDAFLAAQMNASCTRVASCCGRSVDAERKKSGKRVEKQARLPDGYRMATPGQAPDRP